MEEKESVRVTDSACKVVRLKVEYACSVCDFGFRVKVWGKGGCVQVGVITYTRHSCYNKTCFGIGLSIPNCI